MRQYYQGTLDFACGIYAVINALGLLHGLGLDGARQIYAESMARISASPELWKKFLNNEMDHYGIVRDVLWQHCSARPWLCKVTQPFGNYFLRPENFPLAVTKGKLVDFEPYASKTFSHNPSCYDESVMAQEEIVNSLSSWLNNTKTNTRVSILRFHRFMMGAKIPYVSHWTTVKGVSSDAITLYDASSEARALQSIPKKNLFGAFFQEPEVLISPDSIIFIDIKM